MARSEKGGIAALLIWNEVLYRLIDSSSIERLAGATHVQLMARPGEVDVAIGVMALVAKAA